MASLMNKDIEQQCNSVTSVTGKGQAVKQTIPSYVRLQLGFQAWLDVLGYSHRSVQDLPRKVGIFLDWLCAREGYDIGGISRQDIRDFYKYLRDNFKSARGGYLQPRTLNSYIQALKLWSRYLSETDQGDITVDVMYERTRPYVRDLLTQEDICALYAATGSDAYGCLLYTSPSPRDGATSRMPSSA